MQQLYKKLSSRIEEIGFTLQENDEFLKNDYAGVNWEVVTKNLEGVFNDLSEDEEEKLNWMLPWRKTTTVISSKLTLYLDLRLWIRRFFTYLT